MPSHKLTARTVSTAKAGRYGDGAGLYLVVSKSGARKWVFRFSWLGKVTEMGLGSAAMTSLAEARDKAAIARKIRADGQNPIVVGKKERDAKSGIPTFGEATDSLIEAKEEGWKNPKHRAQWRSTLKTYAASLRDLPVDEIDTEAVLEVLKPIWTTKPETASRVRGRIEAVLDAAKAKGHRTGENPATWRGHLSHLLPKNGKLSRGHHAAMNYKDAPAFMARLRARSAMAALALEFTILTASRSGETLGAEWVEFDLKSAVWTVPAARMKDEREHRVPLSRRALEIVKSLIEGRTGEFVFANRRGDKPMSNMAMDMLLRRMGVLDATVHGFRSSFRDWAGDETRFQREIAEAALAHIVGDKAEQAYRRGDALKKRRALMTAWDKYCANNQLS